MTGIQINIKVDTKLKKEVDSVLEDIGISTSDAIRAFLKCLVRNRAIPFPLMADRQYKDEVVAAAARARDPKNLVHVGNSDDLQKYLQEG